MITITRSQARQVSKVVRSIAPRKPAWPVFLEAGPHGLAIQARAEHVAVQLTIDGQYETESLVVPLKALKDCAGSGQAPVTLESAAKGQVFVRWNVRSEQVQQHLQPAGGRGEFPPAPEKVAQNEPGLLAALRDAMAIADVERVRLALDTVRLRGTDGQIAASDGYQMLLQAGFRFPWEGDVRIHRTRLFASGGLPGDLPVRIGRSEHWLTLLAGPWALHLEIDKDGRFPEVESSLPDRAGAVASLAWPASDRQFLLDSLDGLPGREEFHSPVLVELGDEVSISGTSRDSDSTRLVLANSKFIGEPIRWTCRRRHLSRALQFGFDALYVFGAESPVLCDDGRRQYVLMTLSPDRHYPSPGLDAVRIVSPTDENPDVTFDTRSPALAKQHNGNPSNGNGSNGSGGAAHQDEAHTIDSLIEQADAVKTTLKDALAKTSELLAGLKRQRKQSKLVQSTLASLRQLETAEG